MSLLDSLEGLQFLVVTGKGGVGKTTLAAALGRILAGRRRKVLLLEVDPRESLYQALDLPPSGGEILRAGTGMGIQNVRPETVMEALVREQLRLDLLARRVLASPVYRHFTEGAPGLKEMAVLGHALRVVRGDAGPDAPEVDVVVLDAPASGHGVTLLEAPALVSSVIRDGPFGKMSRDLASFVGDPETCGVVLATQAEEMPIQETLETIKAMEARLGRGPEMVVVNGVYPAEGDPGLTLWRDRRAVNERELGRLRENWSGPVAELPLLPIDRGPDLVAELSSRLSPSLESE